MQIYTNPLQSPRLLVLYNFTQLYTDVRQDLVPTILLHCIIVFSYLWFFVEPDDEYM